MVGNPYINEAPAAIKETVKVRGITRGFESTSNDDFRSDREMTVCEMHRRYATDALEFRRVRQEYIMYASRLVAPGTKTLKAPRDRPANEGLAQFYCVTLPSLVLPKPAKAQAPVIQTRGQELKLVYPQPGVDPARFEGLDFERFLLQPMDGPHRAANTEATIAYCLAHPRWRLSVQTHNYIGIA